MTIRSWILIIAMSTWAPTLAAAQVSRRPSGAPPPAPHGNAGPSGARAKDAPGGAAVGPNEADKAGSEATQPVGDAGGCTSSAFDEFKNAVDLDVAKRIAPGGNDIPSATLTPSTKTPPTKTLTTKKQCAQRLIAEQFAGLFGAFGGGVAAPLLQTAGQIVVDRAVSNAWGLLRAKLETAAGCDSNPKIFAHVCGLLDNIRLQDLIGSPRALLDAATQDLLDKLRNVIKTGIHGFDIGGATVALPEILLGALDAWQGGGQASAVAYLRSEAKNLFADVLGAGAGCPSATPSTALCTALLSAGRCIAAGTFPAGPCEIAPATLDDGTRLEARSLLAVIQNAAVDSDPMALLKLFTSLLGRQMQQTPGCADHPGCPALIDAVGRVLEGLFNADWTAVGAGAVASLTAAMDLHLAVAPQHRKLFALLASIGQYAATYSTTGKDPQVVATARRSAIEALIDATTDRADRDSGVVVSVGGDFGIGWGTRRGIRSNASDASAQPTALHLSFGLGLDSYHSGSSLGFHGMLSIADLSQYVAFEDNDFHVANPDAKAALTIGATAGLRFALRQTPMFVGVNVTYSPFVPVKLATDTMPSQTGSYQALVLAAVYVPFFDFN